MHEYCSQSRGFSRNSRPPSRIDRGPQCQKSSSFGRSSSASGMAGTTGLEPAASAVTGQRSNQLNYVPKPLQKCLVVARLCNFAGGAPSGRCSPSAAVPAKTTDQLPWNWRALAKNYLNIEPARSATRVVLRHDHALALKRCSTDCRAIPRYSALHRRHISRVLSGFFRFQDAAQDFSGSGLRKRRHKLQRRRRCDRSQLSAHVFDQRRR